MGAYECDLLLSHVTFAEARFEASVCAHIPGASTISVAARFASLSGGSYRFGRFAGDNECAAARFRLSGIFEVLTPAECVFASFEGVVREGIKS